MTPTDLYRSITADQETHHRTITAAIARLPEDRKQLIAAYAEGMTDREVGPLTHRSHGAARDLLRRIMWAIHKRQHNLPRYHLKGRASKKDQAAKPAASAVREPGPQTHSFRDFLTKREQEKLAG